MSEAYAGKTDAQIIEENAADLNSKDNYQTKDSYNPRGTVTEEQSNVNEAGLEKFPGAEVSVGRSGMSGGGTNPQNIPPEEGGQGRSQTQGESSERFEGVGGPEDKKFEVRMTASVKMWKIYLLQPLSLTSFIYLLFLLVLIFSSPVRPLQTTPAALRHGLAASTSRTPPTKRSLCRRQRARSCSRGKVLSLTRLGVALRRTRRATRGGTKMLRLL